VGRSLPTLRKGTLYLAKVGQNLLPTLATRQPTLASWVSLRELSSSSFENLAPNHSEKSLLLDELFLRRAVIHNLELFN
jgi:hypothetical protein